MRDLLRRTVAWLLVPFLALNRTYAKIPVGPFFILDALIVLKLPFALPTVFRSRAVFLLIGMLALVPLGHLYLDLTSPNVIGTPTILMLRRFATFIYLLIPVVFIDELLLVARLMVARPWLMNGVISLGAIFTHTLNRLVSESLEIHAVVLSTLAGFYAVYLLWLAANGRPGLVRPAAVAGLLAFSTMFSPDGALFKAAFVVIAVAGLLFMMKQPSRMRIAVAGVAATLVFCVMLLVSFRPAMVVLAEVSALGNVMFDTPRMQSDLYGGSVEFARQRGTTESTTHARIAFWSAIMRNGVSSPEVFLVGNGHRHNFMTLLFPGVPFKDKELTEPHNSYLGIFFRYGFAGLALFAALLAWFVREVGRRTEGAGAAGVAPLFLLVPALLFPTPSVILESPHSALHFWLFVTLAAAHVPPPALPPPERRGGARRSWRGAAARGGDGG